MNRTATSRFLLAVLLVVAAIAWGAGCQPRPTAMALGGCDSVPPPLGPTDRRAEVPAVKLAPVPGRGAVVGVIAERGTARPLAGLVRLTRVGAGAGPNGGPDAERATDGAGGFVATGLTPGAYVVRARAILHLPAEQRIEVRADAVDTVRADLAYHACHGY
jgi:hypothetical protein